MEHILLVIDQRVDRLSATVEALRRAGINASGEPTLPAQKPQGVNVGILCLATIVGMEILLEQMRAWGCKVIIWCDRLPPDKRLRGLVIASIFNKNQGLVIDVLGPIPTSSQGVLSAYQEALLNLDLPDESS